jgi:glutamate-1-semialdehyde 2,1-aminomutase
MAAGIATLKQLDHDMYRSMEQCGRRLMDGMREVAAQHDIPLQTDVVGSMIGFFFSAEPIYSYADAKRLCDTARYSRFFHAMLEQGVYLAPSQFEAGFLSTLHDESIIDRTIEAAHSAMAAAR